ncbi:hypothetical protein Q4566_16340 [Tamlana sp. 2_MG-2023]|uniref:hypothetical protein n=1 Tax=unclassified Tamlana TaxID=2614803 RepID=UPI0026E30580|nr:MULTISPECIES: hypothetical protein [unclassified Tamlana]MDO6761779.1 hypothetical protein [Tamlana sp. 2_MG-2023]MDO6792540.1 hypothetical protein [Tamlana sp. 1_MG-2023]
MKYAIVFLFVLTLSSCEYFNVKKTSSEAILNEELKTFNWSDVDEYPGFSICEASDTKEDRKACFQNTLTNHITNYLQKETIIVTQDINDTVMLEFQVSKAGELVLTHATIDSVTVEEIPNIESLLEESLDSLPAIYPAIKRGQQVTTEFQLPLIISVN